MDKRIEDLIRLGVEVRHIPLMKALQNSPKCVNTEDWILAREELKFSRLFDRYLELRKLNSAPKPSLNVSTNYSLIWDNMLNECLEQRKKIHGKERMRKKVLGELSLKVLSSTKKGLQGFQQKNDVASFSISTQSPPSIVRPEIPNEILAPINNWSGSEQIFLMNLITKGIVRNEDIGSNPSGVTSATLLINSIFHQGRAARTTDQVEKLIRYQFTKPTDSASNLSLNEFGTSLLDSSRSTTNTTNNPSTFNKLVLTSMDSKIRNSAVRRKYDRSALMKASATKLIAPSKTYNLSKKLNMSPHPSHDAAARKANQNIAKLFTPHELAMRRLQKSRLGIPDTPVGAGPANANPYGSLPTLNNNSGSFNSINHNVTSTSSHASAIPSSTASNNLSSNYPSLLHQNSLHHSNVSIQQQNIQQQLQRVQQMQASQMSNQLPPPPPHYQQQQQQQHQQQQQRMPSPSLQQKQIQQQILQQQQQLQQAQNARMAPKKE